MAQIIQLNNGVRWFLDSINIQDFLSFMIKVTALNFNKIRYSSNQQKL